jgi:hypothetical protein
MKNRNYELVEESTRLVTNNGEHILVPAETNCRSNMADCTVELKAAACFQSILNNFLDKENKTDLNPVLWHQGEHKMH